MASEELIAVIAHPDGRRSVMPFDAWTEAMCLVLHDAQVAFEVAHGRPPEGQRDWPWLAAWMDDHRRRDLDRLGWSPTEVSG